MRTIGNILWLVLAGLWLAIGYAVAGLVMFLLVVTIPFGIQAFKLASFSLWPFGRTVVDRPGAAPALGCVGNIVWLVLAGIELALAHIVTGLLLCLTIIGIPLGIANFKLVPLALLPFGKEIVPVDRVAPGDVAYHPPPSLGGAGGG
ncbi:MAG TPA: YccF domain-containing protein [Acidimicrobiales bacterium]